MSRPDVEYKAMPGEPAPSVKPGEAQERPAPRPGHLSVVAPDPTSGAGSLFRREMIDHQRRRLQGEVLIGAGPTWVMLGYAAVGVLVAGLLFISLLSYARTETVGGWLVPQGGIVRLTADQGGAIDHIYATEGSRLAAGMPIARLRLSRQAIGGDTGKLLESAGLAQLDAARANSSAAAARIAADQDALKRQEAVLTAQEQQARALLAILEEKHRLAEAKVKRSQDLNARGYLSAQALDDATSSLLDTSQAVATQRSALLLLSQSKADLESKLAQIPIAFAETRANANATEADLVQRLEQTKAGDSYTVNAPSDSVVMAVPAIEGQNLTPGSTIALLQPANTRLEAEVFVPSRAAGFLKVGQEISLQYQPFPYKKFGSAKGRIISISRAPLTPAEVASSGFSVGESVFRVHAALDKPYVVAYGAKTPLQAGTALTAMIVVDRRSLLEWLFDPLFAVARR